MGNNRRDASNAPGAVSYRHARKPGLRRFYNPCAQSDFGASTPARSWFPVRYTGADSRLIIRANCDTVAGAGDLTASDCEPNTDAISHLCSAVPQPYGAAGCVGHGHRCQDSANTRLIAEPIDYTQCRESVSPQWGAGPVRSPVRPLATAVTGELGYGRHSLLVITGPASPHAICCFAAAIHSGTSR